MNTIFKDKIIDGTFYDDIKDPDPEHSMLLEENMTPDELRAMIDYLRKRVVCEDEEGKTIQIAFDNPTGDEMVAAGLNPDGVRCLLGLPWWDEMVTDIIETPDFCEDGDEPEQILEYARDVVSDYIRKRFPLDKI